MKKAYILILTLILTTGCQYFKKEQPIDAIARVNDDYLPASYLKNLIPIDTKAEDSMLLAQTYINRWATEKLLIDRAIINLSADKQQELENLINQYRQDLYTRAYKDAIISQSLDTVISEKTLDSFYQQNSNNFRLNEDILQIRFAQLPKSHSALKSLTENFKRYNHKDSKLLDSLSIQFFKYNFNDSIWVKAVDVINVITPVTIENKDEVLKKSQFSQLEDSLSVYLIFVKDKRIRNEVAPLRYIRETIRQIVLNKRISELNKKLETDITKDAIKNKQFEIYNHENKN
ncbi:MAG: peptidyl-prolyl cis-trans isomerase [Flavobacteriaceae bacterium]|nr:peptidyl-prolyl cis-trans isomerase [Flavobacteriaceae bacterium]MDZ4149126.1 peptidyl-prolyl cis-trans isomerase [Flavobacteriaceae bacterium]